jgi:Undecaprenyl-phosphate glucose phosphotransferase
MVLALAAFALKVSAQFSRVWAFSWFLSAGLLTIGLRLQAAYALRRLARAGRIGRTIAVYGAGLQGARLIGRIDALNEPWNRIAGVFDDRLQRTGPVVGPYPMLGNLQSLVAWSRANLPDEILIALPWAAEERIHSILRTLAVLPANVRLSPEFVCSEFLNGRTSYQFGVPMLSAFEKPLTGWGAVWKRAFDLAASAVLLVTLSPLLLLVAVLIKLESEGPVLFKQRRYGFNNELIGVLKFRTMSATATDPLGDRLTERKDPRITQVGVVLRRFSIDELPQLLNVLLGEMSVVGPRPHAIRTTAGGRQCDEVVGQYAIRHKVKPGITGWAQVNGWRGTMEDEEQLIRRVEHDLHYINNWSPMLDLKIIVRTAWVVATGRNSY